MTPTLDIDAIVLFSGPGGVSTGLRQAGIRRAIGLEIEETAIATARANGHNAVQGDVAKTMPRAFAREHGFTDALRLLLQMSPPCQGLSKAGKGAGREDIDKLLAALEYVATLSMVDARITIPGIVSTLWDQCTDERSPLTFDCIRWIADLHPAYISLEQVPAALPIWEAIAVVLRAWGYSVWTGNVNSEQFGVPQTRKRAILLASRVSEVTPPVPTHSQYHSRSPQRLDEGVMPWVSMAEALGWGVTELVGFPRKYDDRGDAVEMNGQLYRARDLRPASQPSFVVTEKARSWERYAAMGDVVQSRGTIREVDQPAPTLTASMDNGNWRWIDREQLVKIMQERMHNQSGTQFNLEWAADRPAPVIAGRDLVTMPGANANRFNGSTKSRNDGVKVTAQEAGILQSFPADYEWVGSKTAQFTQIGNAVPPLLAAALTVHLVGCVSVGSKSAEVAA